MPHRRSRVRSDLSFLELVSHGRKAPSDRQARLLPGQIDALHVEISTIEAALADPKLYTTDFKKFEKLTRTLDATRAKLAAAEERWLELEAKAEALAS